MTINIFIQMEFHFHKHYSNFYQLINWLSLDLVHIHVEPKSLLFSNVKTRTKGSLNKEKPHNTNSDCILEEDSFCNASKRGASTIANIHIYVPKCTYSLALPSISLILTFQTSILVTFLWILIVSCTAQVASCINFFKDKVQRFCHLLNALLFSGTSGFTKLWQKLFYKIPSNINWM
jgi:hypothetical protein